MRAYFSLRPYGGRREEQSATFLRHRCGRDLACLPPAKRYTEEAMAAQEATEFVAFSNARMFNYVVSKEDRGADKNLDQEGFGKESACTTGTRSNSPSWRWRRA